MLLSQRDRFTSYRFIKLNHFEKPQKIFHVILLIFVANSGQNLNPANA
jgi:hypothetical protein